MATSFPSADCASCHPLHNLCVAYSIGLSSGADVLFSAASATLVQRPSGDINIVLEWDVAGVREDREEEGSQHGMPEAKANRDSSAVLYREVCVFRWRPIVLVLDDELRHGQLQGADAGDDSFNSRRFGLVSLRWGAIAVSTSPQGEDSDSLADMERYEWRNGNVQRYGLKDTCPSRQIGRCAASFLRVDGDGVHFVMAGGRQVGEEWVGLGE